MNWKRGFYRVWLAFRVLWVLLWGALAVGVTYQQEQFEKQAAAARAEYEVQRARYDALVKKSGRTSSGEKRAAAEPTPAASPDIGWVPDPAPTPATGDTSTDDPIARIARGERIEITPQVIAQVIQGKPKTAEPSPKPPPEVRIVQSWPLEPLPPTPPAPYSRTDLAGIWSALFLVPVLFYVLMRGTGWVLGGFRR
jgi:hypothetical protein